MMNYTLKFVFSHFQVKAMRTLPRVFGMLFLFAALIFTIQAITHEKQTIKGHIEGLTLNQDVELNFIFDVGVVADFSYDIRDLFLVAERHSSGDTISANDRFILVEDYSLYDRFALFTINSFSLYGRFASSPPHGVGIEIRSGGEFIAS